MSTGPDVEGHMRFVPPAHPIMLDKSLLSESSPGLPKREAALEPIPRLPKDGGGKGVGASKELLRLELFPSPPLAPPSEKLVPRSLDATAFDEGCCGFCCGCCWFCGKSIGIIATESKLDTAENIGGGWGSSSLCWCCICGMTLMFCCDPMLAMLLPKPLLLFFFLM